jgi:cell shape-determining protein MreC
MKKNRLIFYAIFGGFHLILTIFSFYVDSQKSDFAFLTRMLGWIPTLKWLSVLGLLLFIADVIWNMIDRKELAKENTALNQEMNTLKAKLFDLQEDAKKRSQTPPANPNYKS